MGDTTVPGAGIRGQWVQLWSTALHRHRTSYPSQIPASADLFEKISNLPDAQLWAQSPENSTCLHLAVACIETAWLLSAISIHSQLCLPWAVLSFSVLSLGKAEGTRCQAAEGGQSA